MKSIVIQLGVILTFVGLFVAGRTFAAERTETDELYSESVYVEKAGVEMPGSISDESKPLKPLTGRSVSSNARSTKNSSSN